MDLIDSAMSRIRRELSILFLRFPTLVTIRMPEFLAAFNSLFEIHCGRRLGMVWGYGLLSILFLRFRARALGRNVSEEHVSFNSLFEIHRRATYPIPSTYDYLSILFLRFEAATRREL